MLQDAPLLGARASGASPAPGGSGRAHVFVVDDNPHVLELCNCYLQQGQPLAPDGVETEVHYTSSGEETLRIARELTERGERVAYCLLDFVLPEGMDGVETIDRLWKIDPAIHCTLVTGAGARIESEIERRLPAALLDRWDYLAKPFKRFEFLLAVRRALSSWHARRREEERALENAELLERLETLNRNLEKTVLERTMALARRTEEQTRRDAALEAAQQRLRDAEGCATTLDRMASLGLIAAGVAQELGGPIGYVHANLETLEGHVARIERLLEAYEARLFGDEETANGDLRALRTDLRVDEIREDLAALVAESKEGAERVVGIVAALRGFARPEDTTPSDADLNEGLRNTLRIVQGQIRHRVEVRLDLAELPPVRCLPGRLNQVFLSLLVNAIQAIGTRGRIDLQTRAEGDEVVVRVRDDGCGIPAELHERVFEPFFTTKDASMGTGLGLSISRDIVRKHGGTIAMESTAGRGTCITVRLPVRGLA